MSRPDVEATDVWPFGVRSSFPAGDRPAVMGEMAVLCIWLATKASIRFIIFAFALFMRLSEVAMVKDRTGPADRVTIFLCAFRWAPSSSRLTAT